MISWIAILFSGYARIEILKLFLFFPLPPSPARVFDFHSHSSASDGLLPPAAVASWMAARGVTHMALTDHDTVSGLAEARQAAEAAGIAFVCGVEISAEWEGRSVHIVGLGIDPENACLQAGLASVRGGRVARARRMGEAFATLGISGAFEGAMRHAVNPDLISRAHFARYLVEIGLFKEQARVFERYLTPGKPGYVEHRWAALAEVVDWIHTAGGVAVVAHPGRYRISSGETRRFLEVFKALGGEALEVVSGSHTPEHTRRFTRLALEFDFHASRGSDFHGTAENNATLLAPLPEELKPVWQLLETTV
ncbi:MAG: PHP domain-containing protein [Zoogloeaceae bacterium]|jgi:predicted metal-dependent phosphoesterase TrpH|nr:PHP domain-containing protein [Zoogloeaceae bacterium]